MANKPGFPASFLGQVWPPRHEQVTIDAELAQFACSTHCQSR